MIIERLSEISLSAFVIFQDFHRQSKRSIDSRYMGSMKFLRYLKVIYLYDLKDILENTPILIVLIKWFQFNY